MQYMKIKPKSSQIYVGRPLMGLKLKPIEIIIEEKETSQKPIIKTLPIHTEKSDSVELF